MTSLNLLLGKGHAKLLSKGILKEDNMIKKLIWNEKQWKVNNPTKQKSSSIPIRDQNIQNQIDQAWQRHRKIHSIKTTNKDISKVKPMRAHTKAENNSHAHHEHKCIQIEKYIIQSTTRA